MQTKIENANDILRESFVIKVLTKVKLRIRRKIKMNGIKNIFSID